MKPADIRKKSKEDLRSTLVDLRNQIRDLRFRTGTKELKNHQLMRMTKKDVARIMTILKELEKKS